MKKRLLFSLIFFASIAYGVSQSKEEKANQILEKVIQDKMSEGILAGFAVNGKTIWKSAAGFSDKEEGILLSSNTKTRIASITKLFTAVSVMQLVEQNKVNLDDPVHKYIPNFPKHKKGIIKVKHLLEHSSGMTAYKNRSEIESTKQYNTLTEAMNVFVKRKLKFTPGTSYSYTTYGYVVLGVLIENVSGIPYEEYIQKNILDKAGMPNTKIEKFGVAVENKSSLYHRDRKGKITKASTNNLSNRIPGGGYYSTAQDILAFGNAILENKLIKESTLKLMTQNNGLKKEGNPQGYGWYLYGGKPDHHAVIGHSGAQTGVSCQMVIIPERKEVVVVLANTSGIWGHTFGILVEIISALREK